MSYFKLEAPVGIDTCPFDYHSHFTGILPVTGHGDDARLSLAGVLATVRHGGEHARGELELFRFALDFMIDETSNPFARLVARNVAGRVQYERAECAAENIYVAAVLLGASRYLSMDVLARPAYAPDLFAAVRSEVVDPALAAPEVDGQLLKLVRYFNGKIYSANKYTPFDDCYKLRGSFVKLLCGGDPKDYADWDERQKQRYHAWVDTTFDYLRVQGITHTQTAATEDEMPVLAARATGYNKDNGTDYRLLVHTPHQYFADGALRAYLDRKVLPLLTGAGRDVIIGLDLLGAENKVGNYRELFEFLRDKAGGLRAGFGPDAKARSLKMIVHVHCGEGSGFGPDNRSMLGYYLHEAGFAEEAFYVAFANYIISCNRAAVAKHDDTPRGTRGTAVPYGLFDELFHNNTLTWRGRTLRRFDISSDRSRGLASFNAKRNMMALSETFDSTPDDSNRSWYELLTDDITLYAFRLGHAYHYRNYVAARYPQVAFDTNLGSNAITGASALFDSIEGYRINRGFRHLDGYIDTNVLQAAADSVAYMGADALTHDQVALFLQLSALEQPIGEVLEDHRGAIEAQLKAVLGPIHAENFYFNKYSALVEKLEAADARPGAALRYQALARVLTLFGNWRSYLLGADGQGAEHTDIRHEFLRMSLLLAYELLPTGQKQVGVGLLKELQSLLLEIAGAYWKATVDPKLTFAILASDIRLDAFDGFKSPDSVVTVRRTKTNH